MPSQDDVVAMMNNAPKDCCPVCCYHFDPVQDRQTCPRCNYVCERDALIGEWDDCAWDY